MLPTPILAEVDGFQIAIIVLAVVFGFIKWLWEQWSGKKSEELPERLEEAEIERQLREAAWRQQTGQNTPPLPAPPPPPANPTPSPWQEIRKVWQEAQNASEKQPRPPPAPQRPQPQKPRYTAQTPSQAAKVPAAAPATPQPEMVVKAQTVFSAPAVVSQPAVGAMLESLRALRTDPAAMRRAIVLSEVLGPPKALS